MSDFIRRIQLALRALRGKRHPWIRVTADVRHIRNGKVIWEAKDVEAMLNGLMDEGEQNILDSYFRNQNTPTSFYVGLGNNGGTPGVPAETVILTGITEVAGTGYARIALARNTTDWPTLALDTGDYQVTSAQKTFQNSGGTAWSAADYLFLTDVASGTSGKLIATVALSVSRVLQASDQLQASIKVKLQ